MEGEGKRSVFTHYTNAADTDNIRDIHPFNQKLGYGVEIWREGVRFISDFI